MSGSDQPTPRAPEPERLRAIAAGQTDWGQHANSLTHHRYSAPIAPRSRRRCHCCGKRATHVGMANGLAMTSGCEWAVARWVWDAR